MEERSSSVIDALGLNKHNKPSLGVLTPTGVKPKVWNNIRGSIEEGYINLPQERGNITADMFIRSEMPTDKESADVILNAKRQFGRPKDLADIENFVPYSKENPIIDIATGEGQWNPTLFDRGIFTEEGYPFIQSVETYPGSGVRVPAVMNYKGQIKALGTPIEARIPQITAENAASMTPKQWTAAQDAAIARGDMAEAQRLRDLHFKVSAPDTKVNTKVYHGNRTDNNVVSFDRSKIGSEHKDVGLNGFWFIDNPEIAKWEYARKPESWGKGIENAQFGEVIPAYINLKNPVQMKQLGLRIVESPYGDYPSADESIISLFNRAKSKETVGNDGFIFRLIDSDGNTEPMYESIQNQFVVKDPSKIKRADAVTYDDNGVRIPLGKRDNFNINDIRYGLLPFGMGLTGYGLYNSGK